MSYNIDKVIALKLNASMRSGDLRRLIKSEMYPECNFLDDHETGTSPNELVKLENLNWSGEGSGRCYYEFRKKVLPLILGEAELVLIWEGGNNITGLRVNDGTVEEMDVQYCLVPKKK